MEALNEQVILFIFSFILLVVGVCLSFSSNKNYIISIVFFTFITISLVASINPSESVTELTISKGEVTIKRHNPNAEEVITIAKATLVYKKVEPKIINELTENAEKRSEQQRSDADYLLLATKAWREKQYIDALRYVYAGLSLKPSDIKITSLLMNRMGVLYQISGNNLLAKEIYNEAIEIDPLNSVSQNNLGVIYENEGNVVDAIDRYNKAIEIDSSNHLAYYNLGRIHQQKEEYIKAKEQYQNSIELNPEHSMAHSNLGLMYELLGEQEKAIIEYKEAYKLDNDNANAFNALRLHGENLE